MVMDFIQGFSSLTKHSLPLIHPFTVESTVEIVLYIYKSEKDKTKTTFCCLFCVTGRKKFFWFSEETANHEQGVYQSAHSWTQW